MKILFYTIDMVDGVERLMPWRTVVEIAKYISRSGLYETSICSAQEQGLNQSRRIYEGIQYIKLNMEIGLCDILLTKVDGKLFSIRFAAGWVRKIF